MSDWRKALFTPRRVALVGASATPGKLGHLLLDNLAGDGSRFDGEVIPIHPTARDVAGRRAHVSLRDVCDPVDLVIVATPPADVPSVIADCAAAGASVAVVLSGGFAEAGPHGADLQRHIVATAAAGGVRVVGPNCFGVVATGVGLNASLARGLPEPGGIGLFTQSGAYGMAAFERSREERIGFSSVVACGNKADIDECDVLAAFGDDPATRVVAMVLESIGDGRRFFDLARRITPHKPVVVLKTGRGRAGRRAAAGHTAALASDTAVTLAALRQAGVRVVDDGATLLDLAAALDRQPPLRGRRVGVITNSGGTGVELADLLEAEGLEVPPLSAATQAIVRPALPAYGSAVNPIDVTTDWRRFAEMYGVALAALLASDDVDAVMPVLLQRSALNGEVAARIVAEVAAARARGSSKPVHVCWVAPEEAAGNRRMLLDAGIPCHLWPIRAAHVLARTAESNSPGRAAVPPQPGAGSPPAVAPPSGRWLAASEVFALLGEAGIPVAPWRVAGSRAEALAAAEEIGRPVVLKAEKPGLVHKSDAGGVVLGLDTPAAVGTAYDDVGRRLGTSTVLLQRQVATGLELFVGARRDDRFGPVVLVGLGGVWVEALADVALRLAPLDVAEAMAMLADLRGSALLRGARGRPGVDLEALATLVVRLAAFVAADERVEEVDLNPLVARSDTFVAVDARIRMRDGA